MLAEVTRIDTENRRVILADGELEYDFLIVAVGAVDHYFGHDEWAAFAPGLKSIPDALEIRRRFLAAFEFAERETEEARRRAWMTFVIVGGGPTGVELAGTMSNVARYTLARDFHHIDPTTARVLLIEGLPRVLPTFVEPLSESAREQLRALGVEVRTGERVSTIDADGVTIGDERIEAKTVLWAAGVKASPLGASLDVPLDKAGRVMVEPDLSIPGHGEVFVIGDLAHIEQDGELVPGVAPTALQSGQHAAECIRRTLQGQKRTPFHYRNKGLLATIGRGAAVADLGGRWKFSGVIAWLLWLFVHIFFLVGFRNRLLVMIQWAWSYLTYDRGARLITGRVERTTRDALTGTSDRNYAGGETCRTSD